MIRGFGLLCKINFKSFSTLNLFYHCVGLIDIDEYPCPVCRTRYPYWKIHGSYKRFLIGFRRGKVECSIVNVLRFRCQSCQSTHALLPEFMIAFKSHNLFFVLAVMKDLFSGCLTINQICMKYEISPATLYAWKEAFLKDKKLWLGILQNTYTSALAFLRFLSKEGLKSKLQEFYSITNRSFMQFRVDFRRNGRFTPD